MEASIAQAEQILLQSAYIDQYNNDLDIAFESPLISFMHLSSRRGWNFTRHLDEASR